MSEIRMNAYYYAFDRTGDVGVDSILSAVACAGKAYHHTEGWANEGEDGKSCISEIQDAARKAAAEIKALRDGLAEAKRQYLEADGQYHECLIERDQLITQLAECYRLSGADPDGNEDWRLAPHAVEEVKRLREESDELGMRYNRRTDILNNHIAREKVLEERVSELQNTIRETLDESAAVKHGLVDPLTARVKTLEDAMDCSIYREIIEIVKDYREQSASAYGVDTPGGLEHMGDVWRLLCKWEPIAQQALAAKEPK